MSHHAHQLTRLIPLLRHVISHIGIESTPTGQRLSLTVPRLMAMHALLDEERLPMSELAAALHLSPPLATRMVDELSERALIERFADSTDRRRVLVRLTAAGRKAFDSAYDESEVLIGGVLEQMTTQEADALIVGLEALTRVLHADSGPLAEHTHPHAAKENQ